MKCLSMLAMRYRIQMWARWPKRLFLGHCDSIGRFTKCFHWIQRIQWQKYVSLKGLELATSCVRNQYATTAPARHMWEKGSLNWAQFMLQWFIRLLNSMKVPLHLGKTPLSHYYNWILDFVLFTNILPT